MKDNDVARRWPSHREKILNHPAVQESDDGKAYEDARSRDSIYLELRFCDGKRKSFSLIEGPEIDFDPGDSETITLRFVRADVIVTGRALTTLYEKLLDQRARFIQQDTEAEGELKASTEPFIETIAVKRRED